MTDDKIEAIRARHADVAWRYIELPVIYEDRALLLAEVDRLRAGNEKLREALGWYADPRNHFPVERRNPGDPDPAVIILDEPPILLDGGTLARIALEGKP